MKNFEDLNLDEQVHQGTVLTIVQARGLEKGQFYDIVKAATSLDRAIFTLSVFKMLIETFEREEMPVALCESMTIIARHADKQRQRLLNLMDLIPKESAL